MHSSSHVRRHIAWLSLPALGMLAFAFIFGLAAQPTDQPQTTAQTTPSTDTTVTAAQNTGSIFKSFTYQNQHNGGQQSGAIADSLAAQHSRDFDILIGLHVQYRNAMSSIRSADPSTLVFVYGNAAYASSTDGPQSGVYSDSAYARTSSGDYIRSAGFGNWLMDPESSEWQNGTVASSVAKVNQAGYDGIFYDLWSNAPVNPNYNIASNASGTQTASTAVPFNAGTGSNWTVNDWLPAVLRTADITTTQSPGLITSGNALDTGRSYFRSGQPSSVQFNGSNYLMAEIFVRIPDDPIGTFRSESDWLDDVNMLIDAESNGDSVLALTKTWTSATAAQKEAVHRYALATYLMGANGLSYFGFTEEQGVLETRSPMWDEAEALGGPTGSFQQNGGAYLRYFANGVVAVNPTPSAKIVTLNSNYVTNGNQQVQSLQLAANSAEMLTSTMSQNDASNNTDATTDSGQQTSSGGQSSAGNTTGTNDSSDQTGDDAQASDDTNQSAAGSGTDNNGQDAGSDTGNGTASALEDVSATISLWLILTSLSLLAIVGGTLGYYSMTGHPRVLRRLFGAHHKHTPLHQHVSNVISPKK